MDFQFHEILNSSNIIELFTKEHDQKLLHEITL